VDHILTGHIRVGLPLPLYLPCGQVAVWLSQSILKAPFGRRLNPPGELWQQVRW
jgi:hypothetical protein